MSMMERKKKKTHTNSHTDMSVTRELFWTKMTKACFYGNCQMMMHCTKSTLNVICAMYRWALFYKLFQSKVATKPSFLSHFQKKMATQCNNNNRATFFFLLFSLVRNLMHIH